tara:strand:- start:153 stop:1952 length:1800 start_codon:yes stop_codon:yes gene_type:complete
LKHQERYLITTADELTWKFDQPVIFLGEWCLLYERKHIWKKMDYLVAKPYGLGRSKKDADFFEVNRLNKKLFPEFCGILNQHFKSNHSIRFWQIILGHWFRHILQILFNRIKTLKQCFEHYKICGTTIYDDKNLTLSTKDHNSLYDVCNEDKWNNLLNAKIIKFLDKDFSKKFLKLENKIKINQSLENKFLFNRQSLKMRIFKWCLNKYNKISKNYLKDDDGFIINSYLPIKKEIELELALRQWPQMWGFQDINFDSKKILNLPNKLLRTKLMKKFIYKSEDDFENIVRSLLFELLPICYLEELNIQKKIVDKLPWPKSPKFIFTSNNYFTDEIFKLWTALKVEKGVKYYVGQHGNNYGVKKNFSPHIEELTADKFITWGFKGNLKQHIPAFIFKTAGFKKKKYNSQGGLILIQEHYPFRFNTWDDESEYSKYFTDQKKFVRMLNDKPKDKLIIRLHQDYKRFRWNEKKRWLDFDNRLKLDTGEINIRKLISKNRLVIHSYDSTGILETLSQNVPTLAFLQNGFDDLEDNAIPYYQILVDAGIVHLSTVSLAKKVNYIWDKVDDWWNEHYVQSARKKFCNWNAKSSCNPVTKLKNILIS